MGTCTCIYCRESKSRTAFNREHVLPEAFGKFRGAPSRLKCVCAACNTYFSKAFELAFTRDSVEALRRFEFGHKSLAETADVPYRHVKMIADDGPFPGARMELTPGTADKVELIAQVGFEDRNAGVVVFFPLAELPAVATLERQGLDLRGKIHILARTEEEARKVVEELDRRGLKLRNLVTQQGSWAEPSVMVVKEQTLDLSMVRAIAKIAFNFMAFVGEPGFALQPIFDEARRFIRFGAQTAEPVVGVSRNGELAPGIPFPDCPGCHVIFLDWPRVAGSDIFCKVRLYNEFVYTIVLGRRVPGVWREVRGFWAFDCAKKVAWRVPRIVPQLPPNA